jgi:hypothetical protein
MKVLVYQIGQLGDTIVSIAALRAVRHDGGKNTLLSGLVDEFIRYPPEKTIRQTPLTAVRSRDRADAVAAPLANLYAEIGGRS